jgi:hypothetical protein
MIRLLIIGMADDGPEGQIYTPDTLEELESVFSPPRLEAIEYTGDSTGDMLSSFAWGNYVEAVTKRRGQLVPLPFYGLELAEADDREVIWEEQGASGTAFLRYDRLPVENDVVVASREVVKNGGPIPSIFRLPGSKATISIGGAIELRAINGSSKLNGQVVDVGNMSITCTLLNDPGQTELSWSGNNVRELVEDINQDADIGIIPFEAFPILSSQTSLVQGSYAFSGGSPGVMSANLLEQGIQALDAEELETVLIAGGLTKARRDVVFDNLEDGSATLWFLGVPSSSGSVDPDVVTTALLAETVAQKDKRVWIIPGSTTHVGRRAGQEIQASLASTFTALWLSTQRPPTHLPTKCLDISPFFSDENLHELQGSVCPFTRFIQTGLSPWWSGASNGDDPIVGKILHKINRSLRAVLTDKIGKSMDSVEDITSICYSALQDIENIRSLDIDVTQDIDTLHIRIDIIRLGETRSISFGLTTRKH